MNDFLRRKGASEPGQHGDNRGQQDCRGPIVMGLDGDDEGECTTYHLPVGLGTRKRLADKL